MKKIIIIIIILVILMLLVLGLSFLKQHDWGVNRVKDNIENNTNSIVGEILQNEENVIVGENPEGEADPSRMKLDMTTWKWVKTVYSDGTEVKPNLPEKFTLTFDTKAKTFSASTDCNGVGGEYTVIEYPVLYSKITFDKMMSTLMYCEGSQEAEFSKMLTESSGFLFTSRGELVLTLKYDSGSVYFR